MASDVVMVTGGTGFLGQAVVRHFLEAGQSVVVPWIADPEVPRLEAYLDAQGTDRSALTMVRASVTDPEGAAVALNAAKKTGDLRALALLVGGFAMAPIEETDSATWDRMWAMNATSVFQVVRLALPVLQRTAGGHGGGRIVTVASEPALDRGAPGMATYAAAKAAVVSLTQSLAREGAPHGITANAVAPRIIDTPANREAMPDADTSTWLTPDEIAGVIGFLASDAGASVTGNVLTLSRG